MTKVIVSDKALRELVREALDNKEFSGWSSNGDGPVHVDSNVDPSAAVTDPVNPNFTPQSKTEFGVAVNQLVKDLPDTEMPEIYDTVKHALEINAKKEDQEEMDKKAAQGGTKQVEEAVRKAVRRTLAHMMTEAPAGFRDPADVAADEDPDEPLEDKPRGKHGYKKTAIGNMNDVGGASFEEIAKSLGFSVAGAKQAVDKALEKARFLATSMDDDEKEILILTAMNDYIKMLSKTGELTGSDVQLMKDHPSIVRELDGFREFLHNVIRRARKSGQHVENPLGEAKEYPVAPCPRGDCNGTLRKDGVCGSCKKKSPYGPDDDYFADMNEADVGAVDLAVDAATPNSEPEGVKEALSHESICRLVEAAYPQEKVRVLSTRLKGRIAEASSKRRPGQTHGLRNGQRVTAGSRAQNSRELIADTHSSEEWVYLNDASNGEPVLRQSKHGAGQRYRQGSNPDYDGYQAYPIEYFKNGDWQVYSSHAERGMIQNHQVLDRCALERY